MRAPISATGAGAGITIASGSPLTISADLTSAAAILLTAAESPAAGDDLTVNSGVILESTGSSVTLRAGDNILVSAGSTIKAATTITITADNTDVDGVAGALGSEGFETGAAVVAGSGGTAPAAIVALAELGVTDITVVARNPDKAAGLVELASRVGAAARFCDLDGGAVADAVAAAGVLINTLPAEVAARHAEVFAAAPVLLDAIYDPWPTPLASAVAAAGGRVISGLQMLLHQAFAQVEQFTGLPAPRAAMAAALQ